MEINDPLLFVDLNQNVLFHTNVRLMKTIYLDFLDQMTHLYIFDMLEDHFFDIIGIPVNPSYPF